MSVYREQLKQYCLRKLGAPVVEVNVDDFQIEDAIDDTLQLFHEFHNDGCETAYIAYQITQADITRQYIELPDDIMSVTRTINAGHNLRGGVFSPLHQYHVNQAFFMSKQSLIDYDIAMHHIGLFEKLFVVEPSIEFVKYANQLKMPTTNWAEFEVGQYVMIEAYKAVNPTDFPKVYQDRWVKAYAVECLKETWGQNMRKFEGIQLPGGVTMSGKDMLDEGKEAKKELFAELRSFYEEPMDFFVG
jgi:hypothetical protein